MKFSNLATALSLYGTPSPCVASYISAATDTKPNGILTKPDPIPDAIDTAKPVSFSGLSNS